MSLSQLSYLASLGVVFLHSLVARAMVGASPCDRFRVLGFSCKLVVGGAVV